MTIQDSTQVEVAARYQPGFELPVLAILVTQQVIDAYAEATGDYNPIHVDPDYAAKGPFGRTIAHGLMTLAYAARMLNDWSGGYFDEAGEIEVAFVGPVFAGDTIEVSAVVEALVMRGGRTSARCNLVCRCGERKILAGTVYQPVDNTEVG